LDEIVDFSGVERYIDTPAKRYSSGMTVRLGFAIAAHLDPEILVVDEVLAVGDAEFQKKAIGKMQDVSRGEGRTVLFVSHNMASMQQLCTRGILLENGSVKMAGDMKEVISFYQQQSIELQVLDLLNRKDRQGNGNVRVVDIKILDKFENELTLLIVGSDFYFDVLLEKSENYNEKYIDFSLGISDEFGRRIAILASIYKAKKVELKGKYTHVKVYVPNCPLNIGRYPISCYLADNLEKLDFVDNASAIEIESGDFYNTGIANSKNLGLFLMNYEL
jgi:lipopolysaccharide transport system ATP-binding protein